jgi:hypothetical protein
MTTEHDQLVLSLIVERFSRWAPGSSMAERTETSSQLTVRDGSRFEPVRSPAVRHHRRADAEATRRTR